MSSDLDKIKEAEAALVGIDMRGYNGPANRVAKAAIQNARLAVAQAKLRVEERLAR